MNTKEREEFHNTRFAMTGAELDARAVEIALEVAAKNTKQVLESRIDDVYPYLNTREAMKLCRATVVSLNKWARNGIIKKYKIAGKNLYKRSELIKVIEGVAEGDR